MCKKKFLTRLGGLKSGLARVLPSAFLSCAAAMLLAATAGAGASFSRTGSLATGRTGHTATLLPNGKVLVAGGDNGSNLAGLASAELYNPANGTWSSTGSLVTARYNHTATLLANGKVLVAGGDSSGSPTASAELYDPANGTWSSTGSLVTAGLGATATLLANGKVLAAGGFNNSSGSLASAKLYDPANGTWSSTGSLLPARSGDTATLLANGKVLVTGGGGDSGPLASAELYDPASGSWSSTGSLVTARGFHTATLLPNGKVLVAGGAGGENPFLASAELYDPASGSTSLGNISTRLRVEAGDNALICGIIITGTQPKKVLLRAIGPSTGLSGALSNPVMELHDSTKLLASNDNWGSAPNHQDIADTGIAPKNALESAILTTLDPGSYTAIVRGVNNTTGIALVEAYDLDQTVDSSFGNISTRGLVQTGDNVMIGGFIVVGPDPQKVIVRGIGPSLPLAGKLADPTLELHDGNGVLLMANDNWGTTQEADIIATGIPPRDSLESAIVTTLTPGGYTVIVRGKNNTTGIALVEVYKLD